MLSKKFSFLRFCEFVRRKNISMSFASDSKRLVPSKIVSFGILFLFPLYDAGAKSLFCRAPSCVEHIYILNS